MKAEVYSKKICPHCDRAKALLKRKGIEFVEIDAPTNLDEMQQRVLTASGNLPQKVPQIFLDGAYIGGADQLEAYFRDKDAAEAFDGFKL